MTSGQAKQLPIAPGDISKTQQQLQHSNATVTEGYDRRTLQERRRELAENHVRVTFPGNTKEPAADPERDQLHRLADELPLEAIRDLLKAAGKGTNPVGVYSNEV